MAATFLIVEDQEDEALLLQNALIRAGVQNPVQVVEDGQMAIDYLKGKGIYMDRLLFPMPSLVFLDLKLPNVSGLEVLRWIKQQPELAPIVIVVFTSSNQEADIVQSYRLGANSYVIKPSSFLKLVETVKDLGNWWLKHDRLQRPGHKQNRLDVCGLPD